MGSSEGTCLLATGAGNLCEGHHYYQQLYRRGHIGSGTSGNPVGNHVMQPLYSGKQIGP